MHQDKKDDVTASLRDSLGALVPVPSRESRQRAWQTFEQALERHLAAKQPALSSAEPRR